MIDVSKIRPVDLYNCVSAVEFELEIEIGKDEVVDIALGTHEAFGPETGVAKIVREVLTEAQQETQE